MPKIKTVEVFKDGQAACVNVCDLTAWESRGWSCKEVQDSAPADQEGQAPAVEGEEAPASDEPQKKQRGRPKKQPGE